MIAMSWREKTKGVLPEENQVSVPTWVRQTLAALFVFALLWGASRSPAGLSAGILAASRYAVNHDLTLDEALVWLRQAPDKLASLKWRNLDITVFWRRQVGMEGMTLAWPAQGAVTSLFGWQPNQTGPGMILHKGIDIAAPKGTPVQAVLPGVVVSVRESPEYGLVVEVDHGGGLCTLYAHLDTVAVKENQKLARGDQIGSIGNTGEAGTPHLHFEVRKDGVEIDPMTVLPPQGKGP